MDYDISLDTLDSKSSDFESMKASVEDIYNEFNSCYLSSLSDTEISALKAKIKTNIDSRSAYDVINFYRDVINCIANNIS